MNEANVSRAITLLTSSSAGTLSHLARGSVTTLKAGLASSRSRKKWTCQQLFGKNNRACYKIMYMYRSMQACTWGLPYIKLLLFYHFSIPMFPSMETCFTAAIQSSSSADSSIFQASLANLWSLTEKVKGYTGGGQLSWYIPEATTANDKHAVASMEISSICRTGRSLRFHMHALRRVWRQGY